MQKKCDLYLCTPVEASRLKVLRLFDKIFSEEGSSILAGYLLVSISRVKLVALVSAFRKEKILCFSVPVEYRNCSVSLDAAFEIAKKYIGSDGILSMRDQAHCPPLFWSFGLTTVGSKEKKAGGTLMVDRLDGHVWSLEEYEEYMYDYNNVF